MHPKWVVGAYWELKDGETLRDGVSIVRRAFGKGDNSIETLEGLPDFTYATGVGNLRHSKSTEGVKWMLPKSGKVHPTSDRGK
jgi:hypothetical protein